MDRRTTQTSALCLFFDSMTPVPARISSPSEHNLFFSVSCFFLAYSLPLFLALSLSLSFPPPPPSLPRPSFLPYSASFSPSRQCSRQFAYRREPRSCASPTARTGFWFLWSSLLSQSLTKLSRTIASSLSRTSPFSIPLRRRRPFRTGFFS